MDPVLDVCVREPIMDPIYQIDIYPSLSRDLEISDKYISNKERSLFSLLFLFLSVSSLFLSLFLLRYFSISKDL